MSGYMDRDGGMGVRGCLAVSMEFEIALFRPALYARGEAAVGHRQHFSGTIPLAGPAVTGYLCSRTEYL